MTQGSSHKRFAIKSHGEKYKNYFNTKQDLKTQENYESSFLLFRSIKNHLRQDNGKIIYTCEGGQAKRMTEPTEPVVLNRIVLPEAMNQNLKSKIQIGTPLTGRPINKEKVSYPYMDKVIDEIISVTHTQNPNANRGLPPQQQPSTQMSQIAPSQMQPQLVPTQSTPTQLPVANSPHLIPNQMTPTGYNPNMARYPNPNTPGHSVEHPSHMKSNAMVTEPMRPNTMMPSQHPQDMYNPNAQPLMGHRPGPNPMSRGYPPNMQGQPYGNPSQGPTNPKMMPNQGPGDGRSYPGPYYPNVGGMSNMQGNMPSNMGSNPSGNMPNPQGNMQPGNMNTMPPHMSNYPGNMQQGMPTNMQNPQNMAPNVSNMPGNMPSNMPGNMQGNMSGNMQGNMQGNMPGNMQGNMPMQPYHSHPQQRMPNMGYPPNYKMMNPSGPGQNMMQNPQVGNAPNQRPMPNMGPGPNPGQIPTMGSVPNQGQMPNMGNMTPTGSMSNMGNMTPTGSMPNMGPSGQMPNQNMGNMQPRGVTKKK